MTDILLTGAAGQLGWEITRRAPMAGLTVTPLARDGLDITDRAAVRETVARHAPRVVINAAAYTKVDKAEEEVDLCMAVNRDAPAHLAEACEETGAAFITLSTDYVFDGSASRPWREDDATGPLSVYGRSKLEGEALVAARSARHAILRTEWVFGVHGHNFVRTMLRLAESHPRLRVVDDQTGSPTFAGDLADACLALAPRLISGEAGEDGHGLFHCTAAGSVTWCGFARAIMVCSAAATGVNPPVDAITTAEFPTPARRPAYSVLDTSRLARVHGIALPDWSDGLDRMLAEYLPQSQPEAASRTASG
ncbi:MAG: dTDP-4-dehydrorhamnose reductase [Pseudomonadota bacterium]